MKGGDDMVEFLTSMVTKVGVPPNDISPIGSIIKVSLTAPMVYFIGLALIGGVIMIAKRLKN